MNLWLWIWDIWIEWRQPLRMFDIMNLMVDWIKIVQDHHQSILPSLHRSIHQVKRRCDSLSLFCIDSLLLLSGFWYCRKIAARQCFCSGHKQYISVIYGRPEGFECLFKVASPPALLCCSQSCMTGAFSMIGFFYSIDFYSHQVQEEKKLRYVVQLNPSSLFND